MNNYYVYEYIRLDNNEVFYVGKGKRNRAYDLNKRNELFKNIINSIPYKVEIILENLLESDAFEAEMSFIAYRKSLGQAYCNLTSGGEGCSGYKHSEETKTKLSKMFSGSFSYQFGKPGKKHTEESKLKMSNVSAAAKKVINTITNEIFPSAKVAAKAINVNVGTLRSQLNGRNPNKTNLRYL